MSRSPRPRVKICGVTDVVDSRRSIELGAELIGLNFFPESPRYIAPGAAAELVAASRDGEKSTLWVGVFVNEPVDRAVEIAEQVGLDLLQFHGDETPDEIAPVAERSIKALRVRGDLTADLLDPWRDLGLWGLLIDARHDTLYGGSGDRWNVESLPKALGFAGSDAGAPRVMVAGGLAPDNVAEVARAARPWGLDLCSGVEASKGRKDPALLERLFEALNTSDDLNTDGLSSGSHRLAAASPGDQEKKHGQTTTAA
ncbi:MAG: phosphoribosylanthranilate isomerase [Acidobacteriota bacterium]